jgi:ABC-2 type transport system ATP-binding protein
MNIPGQSGGEETKPNKITPDQDNAIEARGEDTQPNKISAEQDKLSEARVDDTQPNKIVIDQDRVIEAKGLSKQFNNETAVQDLNFYIPRGSIFGFIGPSGCGKTTTIRLLTGIYKPTAGEALVLGVHPQNFTQNARARIGYMPQLFVLYPDLSVWENLNFAAALYGMPIRGRRKRLMELLDFVELTQHRRKLARNISGGMQRRLALASTLVHRPELVFLDEPTAGIDPVLRTKFWEKFRDMKSQGDTLFLTTQYVGEAAYCDFVAIMAEGHLLTVDTPTGLRKKAFGGDIVNLKAIQDISYQNLQELSTLPFVKNLPTHTGSNSVRIIVEEADTALPQLLEWFGQRDIEVETAAEFIPPFDDVFVILIQKEGVNV